MSADPSGAPWDPSVPSAVHVVGIGGAGMSAIATVLSSMGHVVTGSDLIALSMLGIRVTGHEAPAITRYHSQDIRKLLGRIPADASIRSSTTVALLARGRTRLGLVGPAPRGPGPDEGRPPGCNGRRQPAGP